MSTFILFQKSPEEGHYGENLPVAVLVRLSATMATRLANSVNDINEGIFSRLEINLQSDDVRWLSLVAYDSDGGLAPVPGWFSPSTDNLIFAGDSANMDYEEGVVEFTEACQVFSHEEVSESGLTLEKYSGGVLLGATAQTSSRWALHTLGENWSTISNFLTENHPSNEAHFRSSELVTLFTGQTEDSQESGFMNATLQSAGDKVAFSLETRLEVPARLHDQGETAIAEFIQSTLSQAAASFPGLTFQVAIGPSRQAETERQRG